MRPGAGTEAPLAVSPRPPNLFPNEEACARSRGEYAPFDTRMREVVTRTAEAWRGCATGSEVDRLAKVCREHLIQSQDQLGGKGDIKAGETYVIEPGHDAWAVGDETLVELRVRVAVGRAVREGPNASDDRANRAPSDLHGLQGSGSYSPEPITPSPATAQLDILCDGGCHDDPERQAEPEREEEAPFRPGCRPSSR